MKKAKKRQTKGGISVGAMVVVAILILIIAGSFLATGGKLPTKNPDLSEQPHVIVIPPENVTATKGTLQLKTFRGVTMTPTPTPTTPPQLIAEGSLDTKVNTPSNPVVINNLVTGSEYLVNMGGIVKFNSDVASLPMVGDAQWVDMIGTTNCFCDHNNAIFFNGQALTSYDYQTSYNPNHIYTWYITIPGTTLTIAVNDSNYTDNVGTFSYRVYLNNPLTKI